MMQIQYFKSERSVHTFLLLALPYFEKGQLEKWRQTMLKNEKINSEQHRSELSFQEWSERRSAKTKTSTLRLKALSTTSSEEIRWIFGWLHDVYLELSLLYDALTVLDATDNSMINKINDKIIPIIKTTDHILKSYIDVKITEQELKQRAEDFETFAKKYVQKSEYAAVPIS
jgi:hypothetical protein